MENDLMTEREAANYLKRAYATLQRYRRNGDAPPHSKWSGMVYYTKADIDEWLASKKVVPQRRHQTSFDITEVIGL